MIDEVRSREIGGKCFCSLKSTVTESFHLRSNSAPLQEAGTQLEEKVSLCGT